MCDVTLQPAVEARSSVDHLLVALFPPTPHCFLCFVLAVTCHRGKVWWWNPHCSMPASFRLESGLRRKLLNASQGGKVYVKHDVHLGPEETGKSCHYHCCGQVLCSLPGTQKQHGGSGGGRLEQWRLRCCFSIPRQTLGLGGLPLLPLHTSMRLGPSGLDLLPSRPGQQPGRQTVSCVKSGL